MLSCPLELQAKPLQANFALMQECYTKSCSRRDRSVIATEEETYRKVAQSRKITLPGNLYRHNVLTEFCEGRIVTCLNSSARIFLNEFADVPTTGK